MTTQPENLAQLTGLAEFVRVRNPAGRPFAGIELTELGSPADPGRGGVILAAGHVDPVVMAAAVDDYDRWAEASDPDWPTDPRTVGHLQVAVLQTPGGPVLSWDKPVLAWARAVPGRVHPATVVVGR